MKLVSSSETKNKMWWTFIILSIFTRISYGNIRFPNENKCPSFCKCDFAISCDCAGQSLAIDEAMVSHRYNINITIRNCENLSIGRGSLRRSGPLTMVLENIKNLSLSQNSFNIDDSPVPRIDLRIFNSTTELPSQLFPITESNSRVLVGPATVKEVPKLKLSIENTIIKSIQSTAFGNFDIESLSIINSSVENINRYAIQKNKIKKLELTNSTFKLIARNAINLQQSTPIDSLCIMGNSFKEKLPLFLDVHVSGDANISNNKFPNLTKSPWHIVVERDAIVSNNIFENIPENGMELSVKNRVTLSNNRIKRLEGNALRKIYPEVYDAAIFITGNTIGSLEAMSLCLNEKFNNDYVSIKNNLFQQSCHCNITKDIANSLGDKNLTAEMLYEDKIHKQWLQDGKCLSNNSEVSLHYFLYKNCLTNNHLTTVLLISFAVILITLTVFVIIAWRRIKHRNYIQTSDADYQSFTVPAPSSTGQTPWSLVQPDTRTYQETEIHVLFHKAEEIEDPETCDNIQDNPEKTDNMAKEENKIQPSKNYSEADNLTAKKPTARQSCPVLP